MSARSVPVQSLPIYLRDPAKGEQIAVGLDALAKMQIDSIVDADYPSFIEAGVRAQADVFTAAAIATRRFIGRAAAAGEGDE